MKVKALVSFSGVESMAMGEIKDIDESIAKDLLNAKYVEAVEEDAQGGNRKKRKAK